jgi:hypothetical protein
MTKRKWRNIDTLYRKADEDCPTTPTAQNHFMSENLPRFGLGAVVAGVAVALATSSMLILPGAAWLAGPAGVTADPVVANSAVIGLAIALAVAVGAYSGGRVTAVVGRALLRRDGVLAGLLCGSCLALLLLGAGGWAAQFWPASDASTLLVALAVAEFVALAASVLGGIGGARSEAAAVGVKTIHVAKRGLKTVSREAYEQEFFSGESLSRPTP